MGELNEKAHIKAYTGTEGLGFKGNEITSDFDHTAQNILLKNDVRGGMEFYLSEESAAEIMLGRVGREGLYRAKYEARTKDGECYLLIGTHIDHGRARNYGTIYKKDKSGNFFIYNFREKVWRDNDSFAIACRKMEKSASTKDLLNGMAWRVGCFPQQFNPHFTIRTILDNEELIELGDMLNGAAFLTSLGEDWNYPTYDPEEFIAALVPGNARLYGSMIIYGSKGYYLCQHITADDIIEQKGMSNGLDTGMENTVFVTNDINKIRDTAMFLWGERTLFKDKYVFPLSEQVYVETHDLRGPYWVKKKNEEMPLSTAEYSSLQVLAWSIKEYI